MKMMKQALMAMSLSLPLMGIAAGPVPLNGAQQQGETCTVCAIRDAVNNLTTTIISRVQSAGDQVAAYMFTHDAYATASALGNAAKTGIGAQTSRANGRVLSGVMLDELSLMMTPNKHARPFAALCGTDYTENCTKKLGNFSYGAGQTTTKVIPNASFNAAYFMSPTNYANDSDANGPEDAKAYIDFLSGTAYPFEIYDANAYKTLDLNSVTEQQYRVQVRSYLAQLSLGVDNLNYIYTQRLPQPGLGNAAGMANDSESPEAIDQALATHRTGNKQWYQDMEAAPPATVMREMLYVLAEMRYDMYQQKQLQERLLATMSAVELQNASALGQKISTQRGINSDKADDKNTNSATASAGAA